MTVNTIATRPRPVPRPPEAHLPGRWARGCLGVGLLLCATGCSAPQDPADLPFRTGSIERHADGALESATLAGEAELVEGLRCRGWVRWHAGGGLASFQLAHDGVFQGHAFPASTRLFLDPDGRLAHAWLARDAVIDGRPCRGRWKIDTAFHPNGRVKAFFPPESLEIDGVRCVASVFHPVYLHPDGRLRQCKLAADAAVGGRTYRKGETLALP